MLKSASDIRKEAAAKARFWAKERYMDGDPEGAGVLRDLANEILRIPLRKKPD